MGMLSGFRLQPGDRNSCEVVEGAVDAEVVTNPKVLWWVAFRGYIHLPKSRQFCG